MSWAFLAEVALVHGAVLMAVAKLNRDERKNRVALIRARKARQFPGRFERPLTKTTRAARARA